VVEEPPPEEEDGEEQAPAAKAKPGAKGKPPVKGKADEKGKFAKKKDAKKGPPVALIGGVLTVLAVGLLGACAYLFLFKGNDTPLPTINRQGVAPPESSKPADVTQQPVTAFDLTHLLPNDSELVADADVPELLDRSPFGPAAFNTAGAFNKDNVKSHLGLALEDLNRVLLAVNDTDGWLFLVLHTSRPLAQEAV